jgi:dTDP-4-amino-4,6-dideoxygalactose transaminase
MEQLEDILNRKRILASKYEAFFKGSDIEFVSEKENTKANYWLNAVILEDRNERDNFLDFTNSKGIMTRPIWELMNRLEMFKNATTDDLSNSEWLTDRVVNISSGVI